MYAMSPPHNPEDPWDWYIYLHEWLFLMVKYGFHVGKYTSPMDCLGNGRLLKKLLKLHAASPHNTKHFNGICVIPRKTPMWFFVICLHFEGETYLRYSQG